MNQVISMGSSLKYLDFYIDCSYSDFSYIGSSTTYINTYKYIGILGVF